MISSTVSTGITINRLRLKALSIKQSCGWKEVILMESGNAFLLKAQDPFPFDAESALEIFCISFVTAERNATLFSIFCL